MRTSPTIPDVPTPEELLTKAMDAVGIGPTALGKRVGEAYQTINRWRHGRGFNEDAQRRVAVALSLPLDYFSAPDAVAAREAFRARVFAEFEATELGASMTEAERRTLWAQPFFGRRPSVPLYQAWLLALRGSLTHDEADSAVSDSERYDR